MTAVLTTGTYMVNFETVVRGVHPAGLRANVNRIQGIMPFLGKSIGKCFLESASLGSLVCCCVVCAQLHQKLHRQNSHGGIVFQKTHVCYVCP